MIEVRRTQEHERAQIGRWLAEAGLPPLPDGFRAANLLVALDDGELLGSIAIEVRGRRGLLRSAVVAPDQRGEGVGRSLLHAAISRASELGLRDLTLITEGAAGYFERFGFTPISRDEVAREIRATAEFRQQCPETATVMWLSLETRL